MNELYVLRHGETEWNTQRRYQGQLDSPLTERGRDKIREQRQRLEGVDFKRIHCSPLGRCRQTLEILGCPAEKVRFDDRLMEFGLGVLQGKTHDQVAPRHQAQQKMFWERPDQFDLEGAETFAALEERVSSLLEEVRSGRGPLLLISHTVIIKMIFKILEDRPLSHLWQDPHLFPGSLIRFRKEGNRFVLGQIHHPRGLGEPVKAYTA